MLCSVLAASLATATTRLSQRDCSCSLADAQSVRISEMAAESSVHTSRSAVRYSIMSWYSASNLLRLVATCIACSCAAGGQCGGRFQRPREAHEARRWRAQHPPRRSPRKSALCTAGCLCKHTERPKAFAALRAPAHA